MSQLPNIFEFSAYRRFLKSWITSAKSHKIANLSRVAEVASVHATFLSHVLNGTKDLSLEQASLISEFMGLTNLEREYFFTLIQLERAGNQTLKKYWEEKKKQVETEKNRLSQRFDKHRELTADEKALFYSSWIYLATWTSTAISKGQTVSDVATRFALDRNKAEEVLRFLAQIGLCQERGGRFTMNESHVHVSNESPFVVKHHTNWRMKAIQKMDVRDDSELFFTAPMSVSKTDFLVIREKLNKLIQDVVNVAKDSEAEEVFCLNMDLFKS